MNFLLNTPLELRLAGLFAVGVCVGSLLNMGIYRLAWHPRRIGPWSPRPEKAPPRSWSDRLPIVGWWGLRREAPIHGRGFWIRPLLVEMLTGVLFAGLYWWDIEQAALVPRMVIVGPVPNGGMPAPNLLAAMHAQFLAQLVLMCLMIVASLIDADEKTIPDAITVPGAWLGLIVAAVYPWSMLPGEAWQPQGAQIPSVEFMQVASPNVWPGGLLGSPNLPSLAIACGCWLMWCFALLPRLWVTRRGVGKAVVYFFARMLRDKFTLRIAIMGLVGLAAIGTAWRWGEQPHWAGLLSSLIGLVAGGGIVWIVRIIGTWLLGREAMGFGDVTLMAMIGTFVGWQASLLVFFLAPLAGILIGIGQWIAHRDQEIPYGPFLCLAASFIVVRWVACWEWCGHAFEAGWLVPAALSVCIVLLAIALGIWRFIRERILGWD